MNNRKTRNKRGKNPRAEYRQHIKAGKNKKGEELCATTVMHSVAAKQPVVVDIVNGEGTGTVTSHEDIGQGALAD